MEIEDINQDQATKATWRRMGVRYKKLRSRDNRYGPGKVHVGRFSLSSRNYEPICDESMRGAFMGMGWPEVPSDAKVECKKCLAKAHAWKRP